MSMFKKSPRLSSGASTPSRMETGEIARQATGAVVWDIDDTVVLATVVA